MMKITSQKKGIFSHKYEQKISMRAISITLDSIFPLKVLVSNKSKDTHHKSVIAHSRL